MVQGFFLFLRIMAAPAFFYTEHLNDDEIILNEETSKHVVQVLRMPKGAQLNVTDGMGKKALASIIDDHRKKCRLKVEKIALTDKLHPEIAIAISLLKNNARFEWFLEKATEIGVNKIIPLLCNRTSKEKFRLDRVQNIMISAMLQSQQCWLPIIQEPIDYNACVGFIYDQKFIAHCEETTRSMLGSEMKAGLSKIILIGPEGDFTPSEIELALLHNYDPVSLGATRLRTETAGVVAATLMRNFS